MIWDFFYIIGLLPPGEGGPGLITQSGFDQIVDKYFGDATILVALSIYFLTWYIDDIRFTWLVSYEGGLVYYIPFLIYVPPSNNYICIKQKRIFLKLSYFLYVNSYLINIETL